MTKEYGYFDGIRVTVYDGTDRVFRPRWLGEGADTTFLRHHNKVEVFDSLLDFCLRKQPRRVCIYRTYALGDILMLLPLVRQLRRLADLSEPVTIVVEPRFINALGRGLRGWDEIQFVPQQARGEDADYGADVHMNLNSVLEVDHRGGNASNFHRMELYAKPLGLELARKSPHEP